MTTEAPRERTETIRKALIRVLREGPATSRELGAMLGLPERDVIHHLEHLARSLRKTNSRLVMEPAVCESCGFVFEKRTRLGTPGSCPLCKRRRIERPVFSLP